ncbi:barttin isoform X3 [Alligator sinensis]|uniref:Barttin isoform X3 n=1 Tax=Alligator sinensis TaxID=38654 RepID=A0A3Q0GRP3_ALLSI|nr:barttin isoform X3 [Alligator sinensis]
MAEDKTFRYGLIMLGFFLVMIGMFIMSTDKPQVYITFCTLGVLIIAVGITWSMCQCYPKVTFAPIDAEAEKFVSHKPAVLIENEISEKNCSQTPYTSQEEAKVYEKSLPSYDQIQMKTEGSAEDQEVQCAPAPSGSELRTGAHTQPTVQAKAEVHRDSGSDGKTYKDPAAQMETAMASRQLEKPRGEAPLASFQEDTELSSSEGSPSSHLSLQGCGSSQRDQPPSQCPTKKPSAELPSYEDFASIDSSVGEGQEPGQEHPVTPAQSHPSSIPPPRGCAGVADPVSKLSGPRVIQSTEEEDDLYYGGCCGRMWLRTRSPNSLPKETGSSPFTCICYLSHIPLYMFTWQRYVAASVTRNFHQSSVPAAHG